MEVLCLAVLWCLVILFIVILPIIGTIYIVCASILKEKSSKKAWEKFANDTGLNINYHTYSIFGNPGIYNITGKYKGFNYVLEEITESSGDSSVTYTRITMNFPESIDYEVRIYQEKFLNKVGKMLGEQDIEVGNKEFDNTFIIKSQTHYKMHKLLTPELQRKMLYGPHLINISLSEKKLENKIKGHIGEVQDLVYLSDLMWELARNAYGKEITSENNHRKEIPDKSYERKQKSSAIDLHHKAFQEPAKSDFTSDFTGDYSHQYEIKPSPYLKKERLCSSCGASVPAVNKYCIKCGKEM